jgi:hypothetical protein
MTLNGSLSTRVSPLTNGCIAQMIFSFDIIRILTDKFGVNIWQGKTLLSDKVAIAKTIVTTMKMSWYGYGTSPTGNNAYFKRWSKNGTGGTFGWNGSASTTSGVVDLLTQNPTPTSGATNTVPECVTDDGWFHCLAYADMSNGTIASTINTDYVELTITVNQTTTRTFDDDRIISADIVEELSFLNITSPSNELTLKLDNTDDLFNFINLGNMQSIIASKPKIDMEFAVVLSDDVTEEWIPMGTFYMDAWKNNKGNMSIEFTAHDILYILGNTSYPQTAVTNAMTLATAILDSAGVTNRYLDPVLSSYAGNSRKSWVTNARELLQHIAIVTGCTLYQDRYGTLNIRKLPLLTQATTNTRFTTTQTYVGGGGFASGSNYNIVDTAGGMKTISIDQQFDVPEITLDQSIYQINFNIYSTNPAVTTPVSVYTTTNTAIGGNSGESFTLDIELVQSTTLADEIAKRFFDESKYNAIYVSDWRQNPVLETLDVILIHDTETSAKQTRVVKQEFTYEGYLKGTTESRGGI